MSDHHLAQINVGTMKYPLDDPRMHGFTSMLDEVNALADAAPGFVWRLIGDGDADATGLRPTGDEKVLVNFSVWENRQTLWDFVYRSAHLDVMRGRRDWFESPAGQYQVLWWVPAGTIPTVQEALDRLDALRREGSTPRAFTFRDTFTPADLEAARG
ncbi:DUF3291 domain-containing protein [Spirillospora sp. CA-294931]|uniref:DUF3291 domain-containing protein n=1 Tax=Spirillospora sp. CA-294931 TaxID=3240042 RepID=UPI003D8B12CA